MLQKMRDNTQGWITKLIIAIICLVFIVWGLEKMITPGGGGNKEIIKVNGSSVTQQQFYNALQTAQSRAAQQGSHVDVSQLHGQVIKHLIEQAVLKNYAKNNSLYVPESEIDTLIVSMPAFQTNGRFDEQRFMSLVRGSNMTPVAFKESLRSDMELSQLQGAIENSGFVTSHQAQILSRLKNQKRDFSWTELTLSSERKKQQVSDKEITSYYEAHKMDFMSEPKVRVDYILLDQKELSHTIKIAESDVEDAYARYKMEDGARIIPEAAVIVLKVDTKHTSKIQHGKAGEIKKKIGKGASFASLVKQFSEDKKSRENDGRVNRHELKHFSQSLADTLDQLKPGEVSDPVDVNKAVVLVKRVDDGKAHPKPLKLVHASLVEKLQQNQAASFFQEQVQKLTDLSFENYDLSTPEKALNIKVRTTGFFSRDEKGKGVTANRDFVRAAFSDEVINGKNNSDVINISPQRVAVLHVNEYRPSYQMKLVEVRDRIVSRLKERKAKKAIIVNAQKAIESMESGKVSRTSFAKTHNVKWSEVKDANRQYHKVSSLIIDKAFSIPHPHKGRNNYGWVTLPDGDLVIIAVNKVISDEKKTDVKNHTLSNQAGKTNYKDFVRSLKDQADIRILDKSIET